MKTYVRLNSSWRSCEQVDDLRLDRDVERRDGLVGDDQLRVQGERAGDADPLALAAGELVRVAVQVGRARGRRPRAAPAPAAASSREPVAVDPERVADDLADPLARVERGVRVLEDHLHLAPERAQLPPRERRDVGAVEESRVPLVGSCSRTSSRPSVDLPQPDSPTMPSVSPRSHLERDAVDGVHELAGRRGERARTNREVLDEVGGLEQHLARSSVPCALAAQRRRRSAGRTAGSRWHASLRPGATRSRSSGRVAQRSNRCRQRGAKRQPSRRRRAARAARPGSRRAGATRGLSTRGIEPSSPHVYGCCGSRKTAAFGPSSTTLPAYITTTRSASLGDDAHVVRDQEDRRAVVALQPLHQLEDLRLDRHVERRRRLVGDQERRVARERHRDHHALAHPAGELVRVVVDAPLRIRDADLREQLDRSRARLALRHRARARAAARRSASRRCRPASATSSDPGRSSRSRRRGRARISSLEQLQQIAPAVGAPGPRSRAFGSRIRRITASIETVLPEPDSPTIPTTSPAASESERPSTARTSPFSVRNETRRSCTSSSGVRAQACEPAGRARRRRDRRWRSRATTKNAAYITRRQDHRKVEVLQRVVRELADAVQPEDDLGEQRGAADERAEVEAEQADEGDQRRAQSVPQHHAALGQPLGARGAHVVLLLRLDQRRAEHACVDADVEHRQRQPREEQRLEPAERRLA